MKSSIISVGTSILSALSAAFITCGTLCTAGICCVPPLLGLLGLSSYGASYVSFMEPIKPILIGITISSLGYAFYKVYRKPINTAICCEPNTDCCTPDQKHGTQKLLRSKTFLWIVTLICIIIYALPYVFNSKKNNIQINRKTIITTDSLQNSSPCCSNASEEKTCNESCSEEKSN